MVATSYFDPTRTLGSFGGQSAADASVGDQGVPQAQPGIGGVQASPQPQQSQSSGLGSFAQGLGTKALGMGLQYGAKEALNGTALGTGIAESGLGSAAAGLGAVAAGLPGFIQQNYSGGAGAMVGASVGLAAGGPYGAIAGAIVGSVVGSLGSWGPEKPRPWSMEYGDVGANGSWNTDQANGNVTGSRDTRNGENPSGAYGDALIPKFLQTVQGTHNYQGKLGIKQSPEVEGGKPQFIMTNADQTFGEPITFDPKDPSGGLQQVYQRMLATPGKQHMEEAETQRRVALSNTSGSNGQGGGATGGRVKEDGMGFKRGGIVGFVDHASPGRADKVRTKVEHGSYVLPADVVSGMGEGNSLAGKKQIADMVAKVPKSKRAQGGLAGRKMVDVDLSGGEIVLPPHVVEHIGHGDYEHGANTLDERVLAIRKQNIEEQARLPGPKR